MGASSSENGQMADEASGSRRCFAFILFKERGETHCRGRKEKLVDDCTSCCIIKASYFDRGISYG